jgi:hypothetical protein
MPQSYGRRRRSAAEVAPRDTRAPGKDDAGAGLVAVVIALVAIAVSRPWWPPKILNGHTTRRLPETVPGLVIPVVIILYMLKFSKSYPERVTRGEPAATRAAELQRNERRPGAVEQHTGRQDLPLPR